MSIKENLIAKHEINQDLRRELDAALLLIQNYESVIADLKLENSSNLKRFTHDLSNPLQILLMTIESLEDRVPSEITPTLERMKKACDNMTEIVQTIRKLRVSTAHSIPDINIV